MIRRYIAGFIVMLGMAAQDTEPAIVSCAIFVGCAGVAWALACWATADEIGIWRVFPENWKG